MYETPLSFSPQSMTFSSGSAGSDHNKSHSKPLSGTSVGLRILFICCKSFNSGDSPPWIQKILSFTIAATGKQLKH